MSRKPKVGDIIYFESENQANGKTRAVNCSIEGVDAKSGTTATQATPSTAAPKASTPSSKVVPILILTLAVIAVAAFIY